MSAARGFSLFEALVVLILLSLTAALVMPSFSRALRTLELETSGRDMVTRMKLARSQAIAHQKVFRVILFHAEEEGQNETGEEPRDYYMLADDFEQEINRFPLPQGVSIRLERNQVFPLKVSFYPNGRSSGAALVLESEAGRRLEIMVDPITGFAKVVKQRTADS